MMKEIQLFVLKKPFFIGNNLLLFFAFGIFQALEASIKRQLIFLNIFFSQLERLQWKSNHKFQAILIEQNEFQHGEISLFSIFGVFRLSGLCCKEQNRGFYCQVIADQLNTFYVDLDGVISGVVLNK